MAAKITGRRRRGVCSGCGCTNTTPCVKATPIGYVTCAWLDQGYTRCTFCGPVKKAKKR